MKGNTDRDDIAGDRGGGVYRFRRDGIWLRLQPAEGVSQLVERARTLLTGHATNPGFDRLIVVRDADDKAGDPAAGLATQLRSEFQPFDIRGASWRCGDAPKGFPPTLNNLERVVCASLATVYAQSAIEVASWLAAGPHHQAHKQHARSWNARWFADHGCDEFYEHVWTIPEVAAELDVRLAASGATALLEGLAT